MEKNENIGLNKYRDLKKEEIHSHYCIDEIVYGIKHELDRIYQVWSKNNLDCSVMKKDLEEIFKKSGDCYNISCSLEDFANELEKLEKEEQEKPEYSEYINYGFG